MMKKMQKSISLCLIAALAMLIATPLARAQLTNTQTQLANTDENPQSDVTIDTSTFTTWLAQKDYTLQDLDKLSHVEAIKLMHSLSGQIVNKSMGEIRQDLFGNSTGPIPIPGETASGVNPRKESSEGSMLDSPTSGQGCLVVGIWDYAPLGASPGDLFYIHGAYDAIVYNVNYAGYDWVTTLNNQGATYQMVWEWLTWLCASYQNVDLYLLGHGGFDWRGEHYYCPFDSIFNGGISNWGCLYYSYDLASWEVHPYEYKELRLGVGGFCHGAGFYWDFCYQRIAPGHELSDTKTRVWMSSWDELGDQYTEIFCSFFTYAWYPINYDSLTAYNYAYDNSFEYRGAWGTYSYFYNNMGEQSITFPAVYWLDIVAKDEYGNILYNSDIYVDCTYVGSGEAYVQIVPGWHFIDATNPVYDEWLGYEVWVQYGIGNFQITGNTYHEILY